MLCLFLYASLFIKKRVENSKQRNVLTAGADGAGFNADLNSSINFRGGMTASMGDYVAGLGGVIGGTTGLKVAGSLNSTLDLATKIGGAHKQILNVGKKLGVIEKPANGGATGGAGGGGMNP